MRSDDWITILANLRDRGEPCVLLTVLDDRDRKSVV